MATGRETRESFPMANGSPYDYELEEEEEEIRESMGGDDDGDSFGDGGQVKE